MTALFLSIALHEVLFFLLFVLLPVVALIDILISKFEGHKKWYWLLVVFFTNIIGTLYYFLVGRKQKVRG